MRSAAAGTDPARDKQNAKVEAERKAAEEKRAELDLFENVAVNFLKRHAVKQTRESSYLETARILGLKLTDEGEWEETGNGIVAAWKGRKVQEIAKRDVIVLLDAIVDRGAPVMANRTLAAVRKLFNWCVGRDVIAASPCTGVEPPASDNSRDRILTDDELRLVWNAAEIESWPFGAIIKMLVLTGQREGEVAGMRWAELDLEQKTWTLPAPRVKNARPHVVPLSGAVVEILRSLPRIKTAGGFVFVGRNDKPPTAFSHAKDRIDGTVTEANSGKEIPSWVFHDLRRTVASGMQALGILPHVIEKILNHQSGSFKGIAGIYQRHEYAEEKRTALAAWASYVQTVVSGKKADNVIPMRGVR